MTGLAWWSQTAANNSTQDPTINFAEGQSPSSVNDSARALMASASKWRDDISGAIATGGTSTAFTLTSYQSFDSLTRLANQMIAFTPSATNTNAVGVDLTLNVDSLGAKPIRMQPSVALPSGTLVLGTPYVVTYNNSDAVFYLRNMTNPYGIPLAGGMPFFGSTAPNSSFVFPIGQAISRTTYSALFGLLSTTYGSGDGSTTFNLPDVTGRVIAMKEASATRLTSTYFGGNSTNLGATGGAESHTLSTAELPAHNHTITDPGHTHTSGLLNQASSTTLGTLLYLGSVNSGTTAITMQSNTTGITINNSTGGGGAHAIVQPTLIANFIMRVI